jgi:hypothetical protein
MARENPTIWGCDHHYPIEVVRVRSGKRARCLGCGACGPVRASGEEAMFALRDEARYRDKAGEPNPAARSFPYSPKCVGQEFSDVRSQHPA